MELKQYHEEALRTESVIPHVSGVSAPHLYLLLSAAHSLGEMLDQFKKVFFTVSRSILIALKKAWPTCKTWWARFRLSPSPQKSCTMIPKPC